MAPPLRPQLIPHCRTCLRRYAFITCTEWAVPLPSASWQQIRTKKKMANHSATVKVRLLEDMKTFGSKGAIVPVATGLMRNNWFPRGFAEYITRPDLKNLTQHNANMERDYLFGVHASKSAAREADTNGSKENLTSLSDTPEMKRASMFQKTEVAKITPGRATDLLDIFVPPRLDFYRQPIIEEVKEEKNVEQPSSSKPRLFSGAGGDLLAARESIPKPTPTQMSPSASQSIYGSVSTQDILIAVRAAMSENDEASRVVVSVDEIVFVDLPVSEGTESDKLKHVGEFNFELRPKGVDKTIKRRVRIIAQEA